MASYHRVLGVHGRSVKQKSIECDYDIHPWDILINGERWAGKVRLVGFVDSFFLICYSGQSRFEHGIVVYKDDDAIRSTLHNAGVEAVDIGLDAVNKSKMAEGNTEPPKYFQFESQKGGLDYQITSLGHSIGLKTEYPKSSLRKYEIKLRKGRDAVMKKRIKRGVSQHDLFDMMHDAVRLGIITHAELIGVIIGKTYGGTALDDVTSKYFDGLAGGKGTNSLSLAGKKA
ncbi:uncharacterized protein B0H64DRAFT_403111 [Chaetomium fimeti]|jgi:hypothetical protein|uniref:Uncharacterized protein n=1 Tax=Chaetomium fimeti TaxID=1854472 RepID=A0AAE0HAE8_9PEZI|nr:hypothetical protein B0H64DRAFT_403111 [Chaetomium fimeti]